MHYGAPDGLRAATTEQLLATAKPLAPRMAARLVDASKAALDAQTVIVPGTPAAATVLPRLARSLRSVHEQRAEVAEQVEGILDDLPLARVLTSMPGIGGQDRRANPAGDRRHQRIRHPGHLAAHAGLAPVTKRSGSSIRGEHPPKGGNKALKRAMFLSAFASLSDPASRTYYDKKRGEGKKHNAALICLARRRCDVIYAMLRDKQPYQPDRKPAAQAA